MVLELASLPVSSTADASTLANFGREVKGLNPSALNPEEFEEIQRLLYKVSEKLECFWMCLLILAKPARCPTLP